MTIKSYTKLAANTLAPYWLYIKLVLTAAIIAAVFIGGCSYGKTKQEADIVRLSAQVQAYEVANLEVKRLADDANRRAKEAKASAARAKKDAGEAAARAGEVAREANAKARDAQSALDRALRDPKCTDVLEQKVCATIPIP